MTNDLSTKRHAKLDRGVTLEMSPLGGLVLHLVAPGGRATIALQGAQLMHWQPTGHEDVIWMSSVERLNNPPASPKPVRGGTPVCWPWFAAHPSDPTKPAHGFVRTKPWSIEPVAYSPDETRVRLSTRTTSADKVHWPHEAELQLMATLTDTLTLELRTLNTGAETFVLTEALHTYFSVSDISNVSVEGFDAQTYADKLDGFARKPQHGAIAFTAEVDRVYDQHAGGASIIDSGFRRRIDITKTGSGSSVVWNPWSERCARLGDMGPDGYRTMVCVETANAGTDTVTLAPGASHTLTAAYRVVHL